MQTMLLVKIDTRVHNQTNTVFIETIGCRPSCFLRVTKVDTSDTNFVVGL